MWTRVVFRDILEVEKSNLETPELWKVKKIEDSKLPLICHDWGWGCGEWPEMLLPETRMFRKCINT